MKTALPVLVSRRRGASPRVSVVVPCYNYGHYLPGCIESVLMQGGVDLDVLVIDDASTDGSGEVAEQLAVLDRRVHVIRHRVNLGHIDTYNEGLARVDGKYIVLLSADDLLTPGSLRRATALLEAYPSVGFAYGHPRAFSGNDLPRPRNRLRSWSIWGGDDWISLRFRRGFNCIYSPEVVIRASVQRAIGPYRKSLPHSADMFNWLRAAAIGDVGRVDGPDQALRRVHEASMSRTTFGGVVTDLAERLVTYEAFLDSLYPNSPKFDNLLAVARRQLASEALGHACAALAARDEIEVEEFVFFAEAICPDVARLRAWRELDLGRQATVGHRLGRALYARQRDWEGRLRSRRWRWRGV